MVTCGEKNEVRIDYLTKHKLKLPRFNLCRKQNQNLKINNMYGDLVPAVEDQLFGVENPR